MSGLTKPLTFGAERLWVAHNAGFEEGWVLGEHTCQVLVVHFVAQVTNKDPEVVCGKHELHRATTIQMELKHRSEL